jgi:hypothetical protein
LFDENDARKSPLAPKKKQMRTRKVNASSIPRQGAANEKKVE